MDNEEIKLEKVNKIESICPVCKAVTNGENYCRNCGTKLLKDTTKHQINKESSNYKENMNRKATKYKIGILVIVILIIMAVIFILCTRNLLKDNNELNKVNEMSQIKKDMSVEENNGYKTFNFTVDDIIKINSIDTANIIGNSAAPYCTEHNGTTCISLPITLNKYVDTRLVYEKQSRKVISVDLSMNNYDNYFLASDYGVDTNDIGKITALGFEYTQQYLDNFLKKLGLNYDFSQVLTNSEKIRNILTKEEKGITGQYALEKDNVGYIRAVTPIGLLIRIIATDEDDMYNLSVNSLTNLLLNDYFVLEQSLEKDNNSSNTIQDNNNEEYKENSNTLETKDKYTEKNNNQEANVSNENSSKKQYNNDENTTSNEVVEDTREYITLPDFANSTIEDVKNVIEQYNTMFNLNLKCNVAYDSEYPYGKIKSQSIGAGQKAYSGDTITITVGNKIEESNLIVKIFPYSYLGLNMDRIDYVIPEELSVVPVTIIINGNTVYNERVRIESRETKVEETFKVSLNTTVEIRVNDKTVFKRTKDFGAKARTWTIDDMPEF